MGAGQVFDMNKITHAGAVGSVVVAAKNVQGLAFADGDFAGHFDQQGGIGRILSDAAFRVATGNIKITQDDVG